MATPLDQSTLQRTRDTLGKVIKKPPLTDKLLSRPPFRYLHDIISEVNKATGFFKGLYSGAELDGKSIQDKEAKIAFLQKAIDVLSFTQGEVVRVKSSKIVSGQEVERTNEFLQLLSIAILKKLDSAAAVQKVLNGEKPVNREKKRRGGKKVEGGVETGKTEKVEEKGERGGEREERVQGEGISAHSKEKPAETKVRSHDRPKEGREREREKEKVKEKKKEATNEEPPERPHHKSSRAAHVRGGGVGEVMRREGDSGDDEGLGSETRLDRPRSAKGHRRRVETGEREIPDTTHPTQQSPSPPPNITHSQPPPPEPMGLVVSKRPGSARPAPPRVVHHTSPDDITSRVTMETSVAPPTVILDVPGGEEEREEGEGGEGEGGEEDKEYVVNSTVPLAPPTNNNSDVLQSADGITDQPEGALTKTIVATKERLEGVEGREEGEGVPGVVTPAQRKREMEIVKKEMEKLREDIQLLCRYTNPMGRVMDYLQEDTDTMMQELERWRAENAKHSDNLRREESITENELAPLKAQLEEVELHIREERDRIGAMKANIIRQDNSIRQLLDSIIPHS